MLFYWIPLTLFMVEDQAKLLLGTAFLFIRSGRVQQECRCLLQADFSHDNVDQLVTAYHPDGVDVSSGVETDGVKDIAKITAFVERVTRK